MYNAYGMENADGYWTMLQNVFRLIMLKMLLEFSANCTDVKVVNIPAIKSLKYVEYLIYNIISLFNSHKTL